jgi:hypothetical protein
MIDYWLPDGSTGAVTMDVLDAAGKVIRRFTSEGAGERESASGGRDPLTAGTQRMPNAAGLNR